MSDYDNTSRGVLFRNEDKQQETHADYSGSITLPDGTEHWLNAWVKTSSKTGKKFFSLSIGKPKQAPKQEAPQADSGFDDEIPF